MWKKGRYVKTRMKKEMIMKVDDMRAVRHEDEQKGMRSDLRMNRDEGDIESEEKDRVIKDQEWNGIDMIEIELYTKEKCEQKDKGMRRITS